MRHLTLRRGTYAESPRTSLRIKKKKARCRAFVPLRAGRQRPGTRQQVRDAIRSAEAPPLFRAEHTPLRLKTIGISQLLEVQLVPVSV